MSRHNLPQILIIIVFLFASGCASSGNGGGFPFFGKKTEAPPPQTMVNSQMMSGPVMSGQEIQVQPPAAGPNPPPAGEIIGQPSYTPPLSHSPASSSTTYSPSMTHSPSSATGYGSSGSTSTPSPGSTYPSSGSGYNNPSSSGGYPASGNGSSTSNGYYGPSTSIQAPANKHYAAKIQTYSPSSVSNSVGNYGYGQNQYANPSSPMNYQNEFPVTQVTATTADQYTQSKGGTLSIHASSTPEFLVQNGIYTRVGHAQTTILPQQVVYESSVDEALSMPGEIAKNEDTSFVSYNPDSKWDDSDRYESPSMWEAMAAQNINTILGNGDSFQAAESPHLYARPLTARDYQMVVRGQSPKKENGSVLTAQANAIISGRIY